jgi:hypothetical protein
MSSTHVLEGHAVSITPMPSARQSLSSVGPKWVLANALPQVLLVAVPWVYLNANGLNPVELMAPGGLTRLPHPVWLVIGTAGLYAAATGLMRGAVLRPLVPRFSILGWCLATILSSIVMLALTASASVVGLLVSKGLAISGGNPVPIPEGWALAPFVLGIILGAEIIGIILGGLPALIIGAVEALVLCRATRTMGTWILWTAAALSTVVTIIALHAFLVVLYPGLPTSALSFIALAMPVLLGITAALVTLPAVAKLVRRKNEVG